MKPERNISIDLMRGISIFVMIWIHTNAYFLHIPIAYALWDFFEWAVPIFIFCSSYIFFQKPFHFTLGNLLTHLKKRGLRLILPYYIFLLALFPIVYFKFPQKITWDHIIPHFTLTGGVDINWLIVLFLFFTLIIPMISHLYDKRRMFLYVFVALSFTSSIYFLYNPTPVHHKLISWLPWSLIVFFTLYFVRNEHKKWFYWVSIPSSFVIFMISRQILILQGHSLAHYHNKYPPNLYHLSFGFLAIAILYLLCKKGVFNIKPLQKFILFLSHNSYPIYFVHYLILVIATLYFRSFQFNWITLFAAVLFLTVIVQGSINLILKKLRS